MNLQSVGLNSLFIPAKEQSNRKLLMVILHGRGDSAHGFADFSDELKIPQMNYLLLNAPDPYLDGFSWYELPPNQLPGITRSRALLEKVFHAVFRAGYSPSDCFLFGFSQGCLMTIEFGARFSHVLGGYIGISGYVYDVDRLIQETNPEVKRGNWLITHGTHDDVLSIEVTRPQIQQMIQNGFKIDYKEYEKMHTIDPVLELPFLKKWILQKMGLV